MSPEGAQQRRYADNVLEQVLREQRKTNEELAKWREEHAATHGEIRVKIEQLERERDFLLSRTSKHERWINISTGKMTALSVFSGTLGGIVVWIVDHFLLKGGR